MGWQVILTGLDYVPVGEITALFDFTLTKPLNAADTCSFRVRYDNPLYEQLDSLECNVKIYRDDVLEFFGPVITCETSGSSEAASAAVTCQSPAWILDRTFTSATSTTEDKGAYFTRVASNAVGFGWGQYYFSGFAPLIGETLNVSPLWFAPFTVGTNLVPTLATPGENKTLQTVLGEISAGIDGFDWIIVPTEPTPRVPSGAPVGYPIFPSIGTFTGAATIGQARPEVIFEWGMGQRTLSEFQNITSREEQTTFLRTSFTDDAGATKTAQWPDVGPFFDYEPLVTDPDTRKWGILSGDVSLDIPSDPVRLEILKGARELRKQPKRRLAITPRGSYPGEANPPAYRTAWNIGDTVGVRIAGATGKMRINASVRIYAVQFALSDNGTEKMTLTVVEQ